MGQSISIGITTTQHRATTLQICLNEWRKYLPSHAKLFIYCDEQLTGISKAKNAVLSMCDYADHIFIVDDDIFPVCKDWWQPYTTSPLNHACWNYDRKVNRYTVKVDNLGTDVAMACFDELETPNGCMLYFKREVINIVGGWDTDFKGYGYEHVNLSDRIFNNGLTPARYIDVPNSKELFGMVYSSSAIDCQTRSDTIPVNKALWKEKFYSKEFKEYK